jgi:hypothetical protein
MTQGSINASNHSGLEREAPELSVASLPRRSAIGSQPLLMSTFRAGAFHGSQDGDISALWRTAPGALCEAAQAVRRLSTNAPSTLMGVLLGSGGGEFRRRVRC